MRRRTWCTFALVLVFATVGASAPAASGAETEYPSYNGNAFRDLGDYAFEILPNLSSLGVPGAITGNTSVDSRIWNLAFDRGYKVLRLAGTGDLVWVDGYRTQPAAAAGWSGLKLAATQAGHSIALTSAYRCVADQRSLFLSKLYGTSTSAIKSRLAYSSPPGASRHHRLRH